MQNPLTAEHLAHAYKNACMAELQALKPGNVHLFADGHGMTIHDFIKSADASASIIAQPDLTVGERIYSAVEATQKAVGLNTNLGVILLCAPLIHAALLGNVTFSLQENLNHTLNQLTVQDAELTAKAILLANPAGLGNSHQHDVNETPNVTLLEMMRVAAHKDRIAWQYANAYQDIVAFGLQSYTKAIARWQNPAWATTALYLDFLAHRMDTHIARKYGESFATNVMLEAQPFETIFLASDNPKLVHKKLLDWDASLKKRNINPGTSADFTVATVLASLIV
ncbi:MAG TPA: triphosphoribosyl-dephospho-CoA synthase [Methylotenera sp.]|nr:triphosphoribosyl-dephospho-CoA synthase [Methylotenera sp.]